MQMENFAPIMFAGLVIVMLIGFNLADGLGQALLAARGLTFGAVK